MQSYGKAGCTLFFEVYQVKGLVNELLYDNKEEPDQVKFYPKSEGVIQLVLKTKLHLYGNILMIFKHSGSTMNSEIFRLSFNTGFIPSRNMIHCNREMVSPEDAH